MVQIDGVRVFGFFCVQIFILISVPFFAIMFLDECEKYLLNIITQKQINNNNN